jgi:hypothetical protein
VRHAQVTVGRPLGAESAAARILAGAERGRRLVLIGRTAHAAWWVTRVAPAFYERLMARRLRGELESDDERAGMGSGQEPSR